MTCKNCTYLDVKPDKAGRIVVRKGYGYECLAPETKMPDFPDSVTADYRFKWPPQRTYMTGDKGTNCKQFLERQ